MLHVVVYMLASSLWRKTKSYVAYGKLVSHLQLLNDVFNQELEIVKHSLNKTFQKILYLKKNKCRLVDSEIVTGIHQHFVDR